MQTARRKHLMPLTIIIIIMIINLIIILIILLPNLMNNLIMPLSQTALLPILRVINVRRRGIKHTRVKTLGRSRGTPGGNRLGWSLVIV